MGAQGSGNAALAIIDIFRSRPYLRNPMATVLDGHFGMMREYNVVGQLFLDACRRSDNNTFDRALSFLFPP